MKKYTAALFLLLTISMTSCNMFNKGKHLFILSGQSNMAGLKPEESFIPAVEAEFGAENVIVIKDAQGGQPILRWYKDWKSPDGSEPDAQPDLYDRLMTKVDTAVKDEKLASITFIWMQGERDAKEQFGEVYEESLLGLYQQICNDMGTDKVNFIIGRLSDFDLKGERYPDWTMIRDIQVKVAESDPRFGWINTDDLNDGLNRRGKEIKDDLHMSAEGYKIMGERFSQEAIRLINEN